MKTISMSLNEYESERSTLEFQAGARGRAKGFQEALTFLKTALDNPNGDYKVSPNIPEDLIEVIHTVVEKLRTVETQK